MKLDKRELSVLKMVSVKSAVRVGDFLGIYRQLSTARMCLNRFLLWGLLRQDDFFIGGFGITQKGLDCLSKGGEFDFVANNDAIVEINK